MKLISAASIKASLRDIAPSRIAATYIGHDWNSYARKLSEVVVAPDAGTDPAVLVALADRLGWPNIHFLDSLRARIYLGEHAVLGSFNVDTGPERDEQTDAGFIADMPGTIAQLAGLYEGYKAQAIKAYPTDELKRARLAALRER